MNYSCWCRDVQSQLAELERELQAAKAALQDAQQAVTRAKAEENEARRVSILLLASYIV